MIIYTTLKAIAAAHNTTTFHVKKWKKLGFVKEVRCGNYNPPKRVGYLLTSDILPDNKTT